MLSINEQLQREKIVGEGHFLLSSGRHSNVYANKDAIITVPYLRTLMLGYMESMALEIHKSFDAITGPAVAGLAWAAPLADRLNVPLIYPEKHVIDGTTIMHFSRGFPSRMQNKRILLIEDIITTGGSVIKTVDGIIKCGAIPVAVIAIWNRSGWDIMDDVSIPIMLMSVIDTIVKSWEEADCPLCKAEDNYIPLTDPKTGEVLFDKRGH
jgi:orotate phosphoribosyltransferase